MTFTPDTPKPTAILSALYQQNRLYQAVTSRVEGISHPYLNVGHIEGGTHTNVVPGKVTLKLDRRMIPEENPADVEAEVRRVIAEAAASVPGITVEVKRLLRADAWKPDNRNAELVQALQRHGQAVLGEAIPTSGTPLYTDVRLFAAAGIPAAIYGAGPRTVFESNAKRVQHALGGIASEILVREGDDVVQGQVLVRLDDTTTRTSLQIVAGQIDELLARRARLEAERDDARAPVFDSELLARSEQPDVVRAIAQRRLDSVQYVSGCHKDDIR